jgi:hypothetical protein
MLKQIKILQLNHSIMFDNFIFLSCRELGCVPKMEEPFWGVKNNIFGAEWREELDVLL